MVGLEAKHENPGSWNRTLKPPWLKKKREKKKNTKRWLKTHPVRCCVQCLSWFTHSIAALGLRGKKTLHGDRTVGGRKRCKIYAQMKTSEGFGSLTPYTHRQPQHESMWHSGTGMFYVPFQCLVGELIERERERYTKTQTHTDKIGLFLSQCDSYLLCSV